MPPVYPTTTTVESEHNMTRVVAYVDGFNLYHGLKAGYGQRYQWLDLQSLVESLLRPGQQLREVRYFTARIRDNPDAELRQALYLDALAVCCPRVRLVEGRFQDKPRDCPSCGQRWVVYEEKETDVNIAIAMVEDAALDTYDSAILISGDSDLRPVVAAVKRLRPRKRVIAAFPPRRQSLVLMRAVDGYVSIGRDKIRNAQLPRKIVTAGGVVLERPPSWS
jgi:uncharacterized LabA/DUF88 family protein